MPKKFDPHTHEGMLPPLSMSTMFTHHPVLTLIGSEKFIIYFHLQVFCGLWAKNAQVIFQCYVGQAKSRQHFIGYSPAKKCLHALEQHCTSNFLKQYCLTTYVDNFNQAIFLHNVQQYVIFTYGIFTYVNKSCSYAVLSGTSKTRLPKVFPVQFVSCPAVIRIIYPQRNIIQIKTLRSVVQEAPNIITQVKTL